VREVLYIKGREGLGDIVSWLRARTERGTHWFFEELGCETRRVHGKANAGARFDDRIGCDTEVDVDVRRVVHSELGNLVSMLSSKNQSTPT